VQNPSGFLAGRAHEWLLSDAFSLQEKKPPSVAEIFSKRPMAAADAEHHGHRRATFRHHRHPRQHRHHFHPRHHRRHPPRAFSAGFKKVLIKENEDQKPPISSGSPSNTIDTRGTIDVFHPAPFGIVDVLDAFDLRDRTSLLALLGATVPESSPGTCVLRLSAVTVLLQLRARPVSALPPHSPHRAFRNVTGGSTERSTHAGVSLLGVSQWTWTRTAQLFGVSVP